MKGIIDKAVGADGRNQQAKKVSLADFGRFKKNNKQKFKLPKPDYDCIVK
ncbi:hypothetical protein [Cysteiniphilum marinum]|nr:hypothetical protein [Cysteiniphilum marinum]